SRCSPRPSPSFLFLTRRRPPPPPLFPYTTLFRSHLAGLAAPEQGRRVGHSHEPGAGHLEDAELVRRAEAVLDGAEDAVGVVAVALELEDTVDQVLEHPRPCDRAVLRHVADEAGPPT